MASPAIPASPAPMVPTAGRPSSAFPGLQRVKPAVLALIGANVAVMGVFWVAPGQGGGRTVPVGAMVAFVTVYGLVGALRMRVDFSEHRAAFSFTDAVLATGLFYLGAPWLGLAAASGELARSLVSRPAWVKACFNVTSQGATATLSGTAFMLLGGGRHAGPVAWLAALGAVLCWGFLNAGSVAAVIAVAEGRSFQQTLYDALPAALVTTSVAAPFGILMAELLHQGPLYPLLIAPVAIGVWLNNRYASAQRDEHLRVGRLYEATERTSRLDTDIDVLGVLADEARRLLTGAAALCFVRDEAGGWSGRASRSGGVGGARESDLQDLLCLPLPEDGTASIGPVPESFKGLARESDLMILARSARTSGADMLIAVFRARATDSRAHRGLGETLSAFLAHGAVIVANARLLLQLRGSLDAQLEANQRKDEFVATISHELRTPLTVMLGSAQTLLRLEGRISDDDRDRLLHSAVEQGRRLQLLIEDLLLVAAAEQGRVTCDRTTVIAGQLADDVLSDLPDPLRSRVRLRNAAPDAAVLSDRFRLRQILTNLAENAGKYAPEGPVEIDVSEEGDSVCFAVVDHGPGIPAVDRERVFERFVQLDQSSTRAQGGTGLGLFICRRLASELGATLEVDETEGGGCRFVLSVPRLEGRRAGDLPVERVESGERSENLRNPDALRRRPGSQDLAVSL